MSSWSLKEKQQILARVLPQFKEYAESSYKQVTVKNLSRILPRHIEVTYTGMIRTHTLSLHLMCSSRSREIRSLCITTERSWYFEYRIANHLKISLQKMVQQELIYLVRKEIENSTHLVNVLSNLIVQYIP